MKVLELCHRRMWNDGKGYPNIYLNGRQEKVHILIWEQNYGKKSEGMQIHHKDFDKANYDLDNLELVSQPDHFKIHAGWIRTDGSWIAKPCNDCNQILLLKEFYQRKGKTPSALCRECNKQKGTIIRRLKGMLPKKWIKPNELGEYQCHKCNKWKDKSLFRFKKNKPLGCCKVCSNLWLKNWRHKKSAS